MRALIVRGGAAFHEPVAATESFRPFLVGSGYDVEVADTLDVYLSDLSGVDLIVQCWTAGVLTAPQSGGLRAAVEAGTGFAGWHGGIVAAFEDRLYQQMTGGVFVCHPGDFTPHELVVVSDHAIVAGIDRVSLHTERYWVLTDGCSDVHATVTFPAEPPWGRAVTFPAVWTRAWGSGRVFVSTVGHHVPDLDVPEIRRITERGLRWATRSISR